LCLALLTTQSTARWAIATTAAELGAISVADIVLLDFSATWCGPCRSMAPLIGEVRAAGWNVRHIDVDREGDLVKRFGVTGVPCYVLLLKGHEVGRIAGATTHAELENLLAKSRSTANPPAAVATAVPAKAVIPGIPFPATALQSPLLTEPPVKLQSHGAALVLGSATAAHRADLGAAIDRTPDSSRNANTRAPLGSQALANQGAVIDPQTRAALERKLMSATARLRVEDPQGISWGTGTVIDCREGEALILTCGHIFRDSKGKGRIEVDLFGPGGPRGVAGQVVSWDLTRDLALVSVFTEHKIEPVRVGGQDRLATTGEPVVTVGCNGGKDPTVFYSRVTAVDKYLGPANVQVAGQPVQGRSGGGLFGVDGTLIGVCNAADPTDNEGLFAALPTIHEQLDETGLAFVYRNTYPSGIAAGASATAAAGMVVPSMPEAMPVVSFDRRDRADALPTASTGTVPSQSPQSIESLSPGERALLDHVRQHDGKAEVICIVRPHGLSHNASEVFVLQGADRAFVDHLSKAHAGHPFEPHVSGPSPPAQRSDLAALPATNPVR